MLPGMLPGGPGAPPLPGMMPPGGAPGMPPMPPQPSTTTSMSEADLLAAADAQLAALDSIKPPPPPKSPRSGRNRTDSDLPPPPPVNPFDANQLIHANKRDNMSASAGDNNNVALEVNRFTAMLTQGLMSHKEKVESVHGAGAVDHVSAQPAADFGHDRRGQHQFTGNNGRNAFLDPDADEFDNPNGVAMPNPAPDSSKDTGDLSRRSRDRRDRRSRDRGGKRDNSRERRRYRDRERDDRDRRRDRDGDRRRSRDRERESGFNKVDERKKEIGKLVATRGQWAEYVHAGGTYWVHVLTKERTNEKPTDFEVRASRDSSGKTRAHGANDPACVYIQNVPLTWTQVELRQHFQQFGTILSCDAPASLNEPGVNRGYAFVTFTSAEEAKLAQLTMNGFPTIDENNNQKVIQVAIRGQRNMIGGAPGAAGMGGVIESMFDPETTAMLDQQSQIHMQMNLPPQSQSQNPLLKSRGTMINARMNTTSNINPLLDPATAMGPTTNLPSNASANPDNPYGIGMQQQPGMAGAGGNMSTSSTGHLMMPPNSNSFGGSGGNGMQMQGSSSMPDYPFAPSATKGMGKAQPGKEHLKNISCIYWMAGHCHRGESCFYKHDPLEFNTKPMGASRPNLSAHQGEHQVSSFNQAVAELQLQQQGLAPGGSSSGGKGGFRSSNNPNNMPLGGAGGMGIAGLGIGSKVVSTGDYDTGS
ncbi:unnamed protein product [Amoebophrya sp. A120]|nr:unnamed protein product [Amoebophrya sp. A120]|eukprot:GSA120T00014123001.1